VNKNYIGIVPGIGEPAPSPIERAITAKLLAVADIRNGERDAEAVARARWPHDSRVVSIIKADATVGTTGTSGWASQIAGEAFGQFLENLAPLSAAASIIPRGLSSPIGNYASKRLPRRSSAASALAWVEEATPVSARNYTIDQIELEPKKMSVLVAYSRELATYADGETTIMAMLREDIGMALDDAYFSSTASSSAAHPGLLAGVTATALTNTTPLDNLAELAAIVAPNSSDVVFVTGAANALKFRIRHPDARVEVLGSPALPADRLIAVDAGALVHGFDGQPSIMASREALIHMSDSAGEAVNAAGSVSDPLRSLFQTDALSLRVDLTIAFAARRTNAVAFANGVTW
jgi:hypothetical protein